jgi:hypothetical protein
MVETKSLVNIALLPETLYSPVRGKTTEPAIGKLILAAFCLVLE